MLDTDKRTRKQTNGSDHMTFAIGGGNDNIVVHQWAIPSLFSVALEAFPEENITRKFLSLSLDLSFKISLFQFIFLMFFLYSGWFIIAVCGSISVQGTS